MGKRWFWGIGAVVALGGMVVLFWDRANVSPPPGPGSSSRSASPSPAGTAVAPPGSPGGIPTGISGHLAEVISQEVPKLTEATGRIASTRQAVLSGKVQGTVETLAVREGNAVKAGQTLLTIDNRRIVAQLAAADADLENARDRLRRMEALFAEESVAKQELENAQRAFKVAAATRQGLAVQLSDTIIKAPFAGVVTEKRIEAGELVSPGQPLLKIEDVNHLRLEATVAESDLKAIQGGDKVPVVVDALGSEALKGTVALVLPTGDPATHTFLVKVDLPATARLKTGMFGRLQFREGTTKTLLVPQSAVVARGELTGVFTVGLDNTARLRFVKLGRAFGDRMEVVSGLTAGEKVLIEGAKGIDGAPIQAPGHSP
jgi:RND family efflux transporter MFP subunit